MHEAGHHAHDLAPPTSRDTSPVIPKKISILDLPMLCRRQVPSRQITHRLYDSNTWRSSTIIGDLNIAAVILTIG